MPRLAIWFIRSALVHLALGITIGAGLLWQKGVGGLSWLWAWLPLHLHLLLVGWTVQLAIGVAYWILPRFTTKADPDALVSQSRGRERAAWVSFGLLNSSTLLALTSLWPWRWGLAASGVLAALGALAFTLHAWPRIKPFLAVVSSQ